VGGVARRRGSPGRAPRAPGLRSPADGVRRGLSGRTGAARSRGEGPLIGTLLRNFGFLAGGRALGDLALFALLVAISRHFGPEGTGQYGIAVSVASFLALGADFGLTPYTFKVMSPARASGELLGPILALRSVLTLFAFALLIVAGVPFEFTPETRRVVGVVCAWFLLRGFAEGVGATFVARDRAHIAGGLELAFRGAGAAVSIALVLAGGRLSSALAVQVVAAAAQLFCTMAWIRRTVGRPRVRFALPQLSATARCAGPYALSRVVTQLTQRMAVPVIGALLGASAAGLYHAADRFVYALSWIPHFAGISLLPTAIRRHAESDGGAGPLYQRALGGIVLIGIPASAGLFLVAPRAVSLLFGDSFEAAVPVLRILAPLVFANCVSRIMAVFLLAVDRIAARSRLEARAMVVNLIGLVFLVPAFGIPGAALAILIAEVLLVLWFARELAPIVGPPRCGKRLAIALAGTAVFGGVLLALPPISLFASVSVGVLLYVATLMAFPAIRGEEGRALAAWWRSRCVRL
jgi:O-antigen/teichoic acid export membrane protein